jgi:hypothetical protein
VAARRVRLDVAHGLELPGKSGQCVRAHRSGSKNRDEREVLSVAADGT